LIQPRWQLYAKDHPEVSEAVETQQNGFRDLFCCQLSIKWGQLNVYIYYVYMWLYMYSSLCSEYIFIYWHLLSGGF
jgi:hypothetical protein